MAERKMTKDEIVGNALGITGLVMLPIIAGIIIYIERHVEARAIGQARQGEERGKGIPLDDLQRAARHYGVTEDEVLACPDCYPVPERGTGL